MLQIADLERVMREHRFPRIIKKNGLYILELDAKTSMLIPPPHQLWGLAIFMSRLPRVRNNQLEFALIRYRWPEHPVMPDDLVMFNEIAPDLEELP